MLLAVCLVLSLSAGALAASLTPSVDKAVVKAGETVKVTVTLDEEIKDCMTISYKLRFDSNLFDLTATKNLCTTALITPTVVKNDATGSYVGISSLDTTSNGETLPAGDFFEFTFTAKEDVTEQQASFAVEFENFMDSSWTPKYDGFGAGPAATVTVKPASAVEGYTAAVSGGADIRVGDDAVVNVTVANEAETAYNAYMFTMTYDPAVVSYKGVNVSDGITVKDNNGTLKVIGFGADRSCGTAMAFTFTGVAAGETGVTLTEARVDKGDNANIQDAPAATIIAAAATITVGGDYNVNLPDWFTGADTVAPGADYTFNAKDNNYNYTFTGSTMGGAAADVIDNGDGTFTVKNVSGDLNIVSDRTPKSFNVTVTGTGAADVTAAAQATYTVEYSFLLNKDENYDYTVEVMVGGQAYTPTLAADGRTYTIAGADITGDIVINVTKTEKIPENTTINFVGSGSGDVNGGTTQTGKTGEDFSFSITKAEGYEYTVTLDGETLTEANGTYTILGAKLTGKDLTVTVEKKSTATVNVYEYLKLDGKTMFLVTVEGTAGEGKAFAYDGSVMFTSEKYGAAAYLVISDKSLAEVKTEAEGKISIVTAAAEAIVYDGDVNGTNNVDVNDAQLVYNMYNVKYGDFSTVSMLKFLRADVNGDKTVSTLDSAAIVDIILK